MIRIYKGDNQKLVTKGAYETFYKPLGFNIVDEKKTIMAVETPKKVEEKEVKVDHKIKQNKRRK